ncbi:MAG: ATPase P [Deltaproteobacteria bacterium RBG_13_49_15]|nr:MAG: ATPase P [Deltaproteobacteria bacterium RBG_13_49_15]
MIEIKISGYRKLELKQLVLDYNGTLACDGELLGGVKEALTALSEQLTIHVITADTFGKVRSGMAGIPCHIHVFPVENQDTGKLEYIRKLNADHTVSIGNGRNDRMMLKGSALGIAVILNEGAAVETILAADVVCTDIVCALELLLHPLRLTATLRS